MDTVKLAAMIEEVKVLALRPEDKIVLLIPAKLSIEAHVWIKERAAVIFGCKNGIVVLDGGADIEILRTA
jgi:hypothetical protein